MTTMAASGSFLTTRSGMLDCCPNAMNHDFFEVVKKQCRDTEIYASSFSHASFALPILTSGGTAGNGTGTTAGSLAFVLILTLAASLAVTAAILWLGLSHSQIAKERQQYAAARRVLQQKLAPSARRWKHRLVQDQAARSIQTSWRSKRSLLEHERALSAPTLLSLFGGNDPYQFALAASSFSSSKTKNVAYSPPHVQYKTNVDDEESTESSSLPDLVDHKVTSSSQRRHSFRGILLGVTLLVLLSRCLLITDEPWTAHMVGPMHFGLPSSSLSAKNLLGGSTATTTSPVVVSDGGTRAMRQMKKKQKGLSLDCQNSYAQTLGGAYGPFVPF